MLIPNINSAATAPRSTSDSAPAPVAAPQTQVNPEQSQAAVKAATNNAPTQAQIQSALESMNKVLKQNDSGLEFSVDKDTRRTVFKLVESTTGEVIRQYPTEDMLAIARAIDQMPQYQGLLLSQKA